MHIRPLLLTALVMATALAGCGGNSDPDLCSDASCEIEITTPQKGAISGLVVDDRYRPVADAFVVLMPVGLTATTDTLGQFRFGPLDPGAYIVQVNAKGHEAAPKGVDVFAGEYTELEVPARRIFSQDGVTITTQYSVFIDCSFEALVFAGTGAGCAADMSGDSTRTGFDTHMASADANLTTYMVTEVLYNQKGDYALVIGVLDATSTFETYYTESDASGTTYQRVQMEAGTVNNRTNENVGDRNVKWPPGKLFTTAIFPHGDLYNEMQNNPSGVALWGAGVDVGVKAKIVQTIFLGKPDVNVDEYAVLRPAA